MQTLRLHRVFLSLTIFIAVTAASCTDEILAYVNDVFDNNNHNRLLLCLDQMGLVHRQDHLPLLEQVFKAALSNHHWMLVDRLADHAGLFQTDMADVVEEAAAASQFPLVVKLTANSCFHARSMEKTLIFALKQAVSLGKLSVVRHLCQLDDVSPIMLHRCIPDLLAMAPSSHASMVRFLMRLSVSLSEQIGIETFNPLEEYHYQPAFDMLKEDVGSLITAAAFEGNLGAIQFYTTLSGFDLNAVHEQVKEALISASLGGNLLIVQHITSLDGFSYSSMQSAVHEAIVEATFSGELPIIHHLTTLPDFHFDPATFGSAIEAAADEEHLHVMQYFTELSEFTVESVRGSIFKAIGRSMALGHQVLLECLSACTGRSTSLFKSSSNSLFNKEAVIRKIALLVDISMDQAACMVQEALGESVACSHWQIVVFLIDLDNTVPFDRIFVNDNGAARFESSKECLAASLDHPESLDDDDDAAVKALFCNVLEEALLRQDQHVLHSISPNVYA